MNFQYKLRNAEGKIITGFREAPSRERLVRELRESGGQPIAVIPLRSPAAADGVSLRKSLSAGLWAKVNDEEILFFSRDLLSLVHAGVPLVAGLRDVASQTQNRLFRASLEGVIEDVNAGRRLSEALERHPRVFSSYYVNSVRAGEQSGRLESVLQRLVVSLERDLATRLAFQNAVRYPAVVLAVLVLAFTLMITIVVPRIARMFAQFNTVLPLPTRIIIAIGDFMREDGLVLAVLAVAGFFGATLWKQTPGGRAFFDALKLRVPVLGTLFRKVALAKWASILQTLYASGVVLTDALEISASVTGNVWLEAAVLRSRAELLKGRGFAESLGDSKLFPPMVLRMALVGERTGNLEAMLGDIVQHYDREIQYMTKSLTTLVEPFLTVCLGLMILLFALGVFLPMWSMIRLFQH